jgi:D-threonate/D-erythronate kinase
MIVVIADDLSGAAELAGVARRHGLTAEVQTVFTPASDAKVICLDTDSRSLAPGLAGARVEAVAREVVAAQPEGIFKKCDSVLRGAVLAESSALAIAAGKTRILIVPANPSRGRVIRKGNYFVEGQPLHETAFARDPEHPRTTSSVARLVGGDLTNVTIPDTVTLDDVMRHAVGLEEDALPVGGADFFDAILTQWIELRNPRSPADRASSASAGGRTATDPSVAGPTLLVCGSAAAWAQRRREAETLGIAVFALPHPVAEIVRGLRERRCALVGIGDGPETRGAAPPVLAAALAETIGAILRETPVARLLSEGGATSAAVLRAMHWTRLRVSEISPLGVGVLRPVGVSGPTLLIKPGSYSWPSEIWPGSVR